MVVEKTLITELTKKQNMRTAMRISTTDLC